MRHMTDVLPDLSAPIYDVDHNRCRLWYLNYGKEPEQLDSSLPQICVPLFDTIYEQDMVEFINYVDKLCQDIEQYFRTDIITIERNGSKGCCAILYDAGATRYREE